MKPTTVCPYPRVGIGVFIRKNGQFLLGLRQGAHGANTWGLAGGKLELGESFEDCAIREAAEETGLQIANIRQVYVTNDLFPEENLHYATVFMVADWVAGEPELREPDKCREWRWFTAATLPTNIFTGLTNLQKAYPSLTFLDKP